MNRRSKLNILIEKKLKDYSKSIYKDNDFKRLLSLCRDFNKEEINKAYHKGFHEGLQLNSTKAENNYILLKDTKWKNNLFRH